MDAAVLPPWTRRFSPKVQISSLVWVQKRCAWAPEMGALSQVFRVISIVSRLLLCLDAMSATSAASDCWLVKCWFLTACEVSDYAVVTFACLTLKPSQCAFGVHQLRNLCIWLRMGPSTTAGPHTVRGLCVGRAGSFKQHTFPARWTLKRCSGAQRWHMNTSTVRTRPVKHHVWTMQTK